MLIGNRPQSFVYMFNVRSLVRALSALFFVCRLRSKKLINSNDDHTVGTIHTITKIQDQS